MNEPAKFNSVVSFLWAIADLLNGAFKKSEFQKIILPFTVLRRLDYALEKTKDKVLETEHTLKEKGLENRHGQLCRAAGYAFYNTSKFTYESLLHDDANLALNLRQYVMGFSPNVREIFAAFNFDDTIRDLSRVNLLYLLMERFNEKSKVDLRPASMSNHEMGYVFEHLLRKFNEALNENPGEHFTPRDAIRLMVDLVLMLDTGLAGTEGVTRTVYDSGCGTGGILSITKEHVLQINPQAKVFLYGQELNPFTWAIARADMLILEPEGKDAENIKLGSTLSNDQLSGMRFDLQFVNPPYGYEWSKDFDAVTAEAARGFDGRFGAGLPRKSDGQMLFLQHLIARMNDPEESQSYIGIILNGSPLFTGGAASGESEIRRWIMENDWLEAIVALPQQIFYNTGIGTYIWIVTNRKEIRRKGKIQLIDARERWQPLRRSLGDKRREFSEAHITDIVREYGDMRGSDTNKVFDNADFGYHRLTIERPLRLAFQITLERKERFLDACPELLDDLQAIDKAIGREPGSDWNAVWKKVQTLVKNRESKWRAPQTKAFREAFTDIDPKAQAVILKKSGSKTEFEADPKLRDFENVQLKEDVQAYFEREVLPHVADAWIDHEKTKVGYEINFNRHFYRFTPPRPLAEIDADLRRAEEEIVRLLGAVTQGAGV